MSPLANSNVLPPQRPVRLRRRIIRPSRGTLTIYWTRRNGLRSYAPLKRRTVSLEDRPARLLVSELSVRHFSFGCKGWAFASRPCRVHLSLNPKERRDKPEPMRLRL